MRLKGINAPRVGIDTMSKGITALREGTDAMLKGITALREGIDAMFKGITALREGVDTMLAGGYVPLEGSADGGRMVSYPEIKALSGRGLIAPSSLRATNLLLRNFP